MIYYWVTDFSEGVSAVREKENSDWYFIDMDGNRVENLPEAEYLSPFSDGLCLIVKDRKVGYMDHSGKIVIPCQYDFCTPFVGGYAVVTFEEPEKGPWDFEEQVNNLTERGRGPYGIIDKKGEFVLKPQYPRPPVILPGGAAIVWKVEGDEVFEYLIDIENGGKTIEKSRDSLPLEIFELL